MYTHKEDALMRMIRVSDFEVQALLDSWAIIRPLVTDLQSQQSCLGDERDYTQHYSIIFHNFLP